MASACEYSVQKCIIRVMAVLMMMALWFVNHFLGSVMLINRFASPFILQLALSFELAGKEELERSVVSFSLGRFKCTEATCPPLSLAVQSRECCRLFDLNACGMHFHFNVRQISRSIALMSCSMTSGPMWNMLKL